MEVDTDDIGVDDLVYLWDMWFDSAQMVDRTGGPVRWVALEATPGQEPERVVLETPYPAPLWYWGRDPVREEDPHALSESDRHRAVPRLFVDLRWPELAEAWDEAAKVYVSAFATQEGFGSRVWVAAAFAADHSELAMHWPTVQELTEAKLRNRQAMQEATDLAAALRDWEANDDSAVEEAASITGWAARFLEAAGPRAEVVAKIRWSTDAGGAQQPNGPD